MKKVTETSTVSEKFSWEGWNVTEWLKGNWKTVKELIKVGAPLVLGLQLFQNNPALVALITAVGKMALDAVEYYFSDVKLKTV